MPDPVALQIQTPNIMNTLGTLMGVASTAQQMKLKNIDIQRAQQTLPYEVRTAAAGAQTAETQSAFAQWRLNKDQADQAYQIAGGLLKDPAILSGNSKGIVTSLMEAEDRMRAYKIPEDMIRVQLGPLYTIAAHNPGNVQQVLKNIVLGGIAAAGQGGAATPQGPVISSGQQTQQFNVNPLAGPTGPVAGTQVQQQIPPTAPVFNPQTQTPGYYGPQGRNIPAPAPRPVPVTGPSLSDQQEIPIRTQERVAVNAAAAQVPTQHFNNQQIIKLADTAYTGTGASKWASVMGAMGIQNISGDAAADFQRMQHFMALQAQANASAMGAGTDAARAMAEAATNKTNWTEKAVVTTAKVNDALATGVDLFNQGMEKAIANANGNVIAKRDFQNQWAKVFDVRAMQLENAVKSGDKAEISNIVQSVGGPKSIGARNLAAKVQAIDRLVSQGHM